MKSSRRVPMMYTKSHKKQHHKCCLYFHTFVLVFKVVLSDVLGSKDVVEGSDGRMDGWTRRIVIGRIRVKTELYAQIRFYVLSLVNIVGWHGTFEGEVDFYASISSMCRGRARQREGVNVHEGARTAEGGGGGAHASGGSMHPIVCCMRPLRRRMRPSTSVCAPPIGICAPQSTVCAPYVSICAPPTCVYAPPPAYAPLSQPYTPGATPTIQRGSDVAATVDKISLDLPCPRSRRRWPLSDGHEPYRTWRTDGRDETDGRTDNPASILATSTTKCLLSTTVLIATLRTLFTPTDSSSDNNCIINYLIPIINSKMGLLSEDPCLF
jgi:hypothetical protein